MDQKQCVLLLNIAFLLFYITIGQTELVKKNHSRSGNSTEAENATIISSKENPKGRNKEVRVLDMYRVIPAAITIMIFVVGSLSIFFYERSKERKKHRMKTDDIDEDEDSELNAAWLSTLAKKNQRKGTVLERVRKMSFSIKGMHSEVDLEKQRKYKIYDEMLEKYRETLRVLRKGTKPQISSEGRPAARLKQLAELHKQRTTDTYKSEEASDSATAGEATSSMDQYSLTLEMLKQEADDNTMDTMNEYIEEESIEEEDEDLISENVEHKALDGNEQQEIDPVFLTKRRRSSRFRKQAVIDEDGSFDRPSVSKAAALFQSYMASQEDIEISVNETPTVNSEENDDDDDLELIKVLEQSSESEISALHRIQKRMRPKSFIETLASIHREATSLMSPIAYSMHSLTKTGSKGSLSNLGKKAVNPVTKSAEVLNPTNETASSSSPVLREKEKPRNRPKSLYEPAATRRKLSHTRKQRARPASLYMQHRIQEAIPETQREIPIKIESGTPLKGSRSSSHKYLDIGSLHDIPFSAMTADEEENVIAEIEKHLIAQVCDENDLSNHEIKALERLLDDVTEYSKDDSPSLKLNVQKQYSFTDSISMFGDMDHNELEEVDESEETVLMSLKDSSLPSSSKRASYSAYDNV